MSGTTAPPLAPLLLFAYNRPQHTARCLDSLAAGPLARECTLIAYVDGARDAAGAGLQDEVCAAIETRRGQFAQLAIHRRERNLGLAASVIDGVTRTLQSHPSVIALEDDLVVAGGFLEYMNSTLRHYAGDSRVGSVHAYCYPGMPAEPPFFFLPGGDCWGWATWRDRWTMFDADGRRLLRNLLHSQRLRAFTLNFTAPYLRMLCRQILGRNNSWAVRWHASLFLRGRLTLYPAVSFVQNTGLDGSGTHCDTTDAYQSLLSDLRVDEHTPLPLPAPSAAAERHFQRFFCAGSSGNRGALHALRYRLGSPLLDLYWLTRALLSR